MKNISKIHYQKIYLNHFQSNNLFNFLSNKLDQTEKLSIILFVYNIDTRDDLFDIKKDNLMRNIFKSELNIWKNNIERGKMNYKNI